MAKVVSAITARVEVIGKLKDGNYGPYRSVLFLDLALPAGSEEAKIWKSLNDEECQPLTKGATVQLVPAGADKNGKDKHNIVLMNATAPAAQVQAQASSIDLDRDKKRAIAAYVEGQADLLKFCWETARTKLADVTSDEESLRCAASTLFIGAQRKFNL